MNDVWNKYKDYLLLALFALISCAAYVFYSNQESGLGFPLDDAWIHHTFARNLARFGEWSFLPGEPSGASTGPLWGALLAIFYLIGLNPIWGNYLLGFLMLWALGILGMRIALRVLPDYPRAALLMGVLLVFEWHLVWAALSGMETMLLGIISLAISVWILEQRDNWWLPGLLVGITIWIRPDGLTLLGPVLWIYAFRAAKIKRTAIVEFFGVFLAFLVPYFLFNQSISGDIWPNTFYAKQAEYAFLYDRSILTRLGTMTYQFLIGVGIALLPGLFIEVVDMIKSRDWARIGIFLWAVGYVLIYSWRLPVAYQHGRYVMPVMPVAFVLGGLGLLRAIRLNSPDFLPRILSRAWAGVAAGTLLVFLILGARSFALDVGVINTEMVRGSQWIRDNTPEDAIVAAHDVGALGYFGNRQIRDLAGLVMPDVIPFLWDDDQLGAYLDEQGVDYLFTFSDWYPGLVMGREIIYQTEGEYAPLFGMENFAVYLWD